MKVAPYSSCVSCFKGDTSTAVSVEGTADFHVAAMAHLAGIPVKQAAATFRIVAQEELGCNPGKVPDGRFQGAFRLCEDCAAKTGATVVPVAELRPGHDVFAYVEPDAEPCATSMPT